jgi:hypothetical protein
MGAAQRNPSCCPGYLIGFVKTDSSRKAAKHARKRSGADLMGCAVLHPSYDRTEPGGWVQRSKEQGPRIRGVEGPREKEKTERPTSNAQRPTLNEEQIVGWVERSATHGDVRQTDRVL